jgi:hypothetical protein
MNLLFRCRVSKRYFRKVEEVYKEVTLAEWNNSFIRPGLRPRRRKRRLKNFLRRGISFRGFVKVNLGDVFLLMKSMNSTYRELNDEVVVEKAISLEEVSGNET